MRSGLVLLVGIFGIFLLFSWNNSAFAQVDGAPDGETPEVIPPLTYNIEEAGVDVKLSWLPDNINTEVPTLFMLEFLDSSTGERIPDVAYSARLSVEGTGFEFSHDGGAPDGVDVFETQFESQGRLDILVDLVQIGETPTQGSAQFSLNVVPEFQAIVGIIMAAAVGGTVAASRFLRRPF